MFPFIFFGCHFSIYFSTRPPREAPAVEDPPRMDRCHLYSEIFLCRRDVGIGNDLSHVIRVGDLDTQKRRAPGGCYGGTI